MSLVGPTFGPETRVYGGYQQKAAVKPEPTSDDNGTGYSFEESGRELVSRYGDGTDWLVDRTNGLANWIKRNDQTSRDQNSAPGAIEVEIDLDSRVEANVKTEDGALVVNRIISNTTGAQEIDHVEVKDGNVHGFELRRSPVGIVRGTEYTAGVGADEVLEKRLDTSAAKTNYARIFIDLAQI